MRPACVRDERPKRLGGLQQMDARRAHRRPTSYDYAAGSCPCNSTGPADAGPAGRPGRSGSTTTQRCAGRSTGLLTKPSKTRATAATVTAASRYANTIKTVLFAMPCASLAKLEAMAKIETV